MVHSFFVFLQNLEATFSTGNPSGLLILFFLAVITDIGIPVPFVLDTILILTAYNVFSTHSHDWTPVVLIVAMLFAGRQAGSGALYMLSRYMGKAFLDWIRRHVPSIGNGIDAFVARLNHWAPLAVVSGRLTPGLLQMTSIAAGSIRLRYFDFAVGIAIASIAYDGILVLLAFIAAHSPKSGDINFTIWLLIALIIVVCILWPTLFYLLRRSKRQTFR